MAGQWHLDGQWCLSLGTWGGVRLRLHVSFLLLALGTVHLGWLYEREPANQGVLLAAGGGLLILFVCSLLHGLAHRFVAGTEEGPQELVLGPWGELEPSEAMPHPRAEMAVRLAGPATNLVLGILAATGLMFAHEPQIWGMLHPFASLGLLTGPWWLVGLKLTVWINWVMLLVNLMIPAYPFDGGRLLCAAIWAARPSLGRRGAMVAVIRLAPLLVLAAGVGVFLFREQEYHGILPLWLPLTLLVIVVSLGWRQELIQEMKALAAEDAMRDLVASFRASHDRTLAERYDQEADSHSLGLRQTESAPPRARPEPPRWLRLRRWWEGRRRARLQRQRQIEAAEEGRLDEILERVHRDGMSQLSAADRALLLRVSHRLRDRIDSP